MKNSADQGECYPQRPKDEVDNTLLDLQNSSYPTLPHSIIAKYSDILSITTIFTSVTILRHEKDLFNNRAVILTWKI